MKAKNKLLLFFLCCVINCVFFTIMAAADNETQSPEEIAQIQAENEEYERTHPKPKTPPPPLTSSWTEISTDDKSMDIGTMYADNERVVYLDKNTNTYHMGFCEYYKEKSGGDYSNPLWLADIVMSGTRCSLCIPDEVYHIYREAVYRQKIKEQEYWLRPMGKIIVALIIIWLLSVILLLFIIIKLKKRIQIKNRIDEIYSREF